MKKVKVPHKSVRSRDTLYSQPREAITEFVFDESVVSVFEDMIGRSVPGYSTLLSMFPVLAREFVQENSSCYDLGCSLGASTLAILQGISAENVQIFSIDNSSAMVEKCKSMLSEHAGNAEVIVQQADICAVDINSASLVVMNFTLQFIEGSKRQLLMDKIYSGMNDGGALILSEKIRPDSSEYQRLNELHLMFKKANGYSDLEISQKRSSLENVLIPESIDNHIQRLKQAGFSEVFCWFQCFNFVSILAIK